MKGDVTGYTQHRDTLEQSRRAGAANAPEAVLPEGVVLSLAHRGKGLQDISDMNSLSSTQSQELLQRSLRQFGCSLFLFYFFHFFKAYFYE